MSSGYFGVYKHGKRFQAKFRHRGELVRLGYSFETATEAAVAVARYLRQQGHVAAAPKAASAARV